MGEPRLRATVRLVPADGRPATESSQGLIGRPERAPRSTPASGDSHAGSKRAGASVAKGPRLRGKTALVIVAVAVTAVTVYGLPYFLLPVAQRLRHPLHVWLKPSGHVGQAAGLVAFSLFAFLYLYPVRKRFRALAFLGRLDRWLDVHIVAGLAVPAVGALHAGWRFHGLIGLGYLAMLLVSLSGIVGRYLYTRIPRGRSGLELDLEAVETRRRELARRIAGIAGVDTREVETTLASALESHGGGGVLATLRGLLADDLVRWRAIRRLRKQWSQRSVDSSALREALGLARRQIALTQQLRMLDATHRVFRLWHVVHRPFSITAFVAVAIHVAVAVSLGVTWFW